MTALTVNMKKISNLISIFRKYMQFFRFSMLITNITIHVKLFSFYWQCFNIILSLKQNNETIIIKDPAIKEKDAALEIIAINYENMALQAQRDVYQSHLQRFQDTIIHLRTHYVNHARDPTKDNIIITVRKQIRSAQDNYHDLPYYVSRIQQRKRYVKLRWFDRHCPYHEVIVEIDSLNSMNPFNRFKEEGNVEWRYNHFRLIDLTREELYVMGVPAILDDEKE